MGDALFMTGATGFLGKLLLKKYLPDEREIFLLTQEKFRPAMEEFLDAQNRAGTMKATVRMVDGDITAPGLGLPRGDAEEILEMTSIAYHLAAAYRLDLPRDIGYLINVDGTRNTLDFLEKAPNLRRFGYFSTTAIAGGHSGPYNETDFDVGQRHSNFYTETKFEAEKLVRERTGKIPATIFRPTIIVGDSRTGEMEKIDGPYYAFIMISRRLHLVMQKSPGVPCNIEPADFVIDAVFAIMNRPDAAGLTVHIADPNPPSYDEFFDMVFEHWGTFRPLLRVPPKLMLPMFYIPGFSRLTGVPRASYMYILNPLRFGTEVLERMLEGTGVSCPPVESYVGAMVSYFREKFDRKAARRARW